jgi:hypothetical protein
MSRPVTRTSHLLAFALLLCCVASDALAQFASNIRLTNPIGRTVLEIRKGTQPANPRLLFTAVITAGPTGGTTSILLQQAFLRDIFNPAVPAAGWTTVLSTGTAFSLGGGCGRNNLIDFPFINNNRPVILRITGTTSQIITLGIAGTDQYDGADCLVQRDGRVLYMLTNRTRQRLEFRREQGGLLQLVRDDFGTVITPFGGGMRPSIARVLPRNAVAVNPMPFASNEETVAFRGDPDPAVRVFIAYLQRESITPSNAETVIFRLVDDNVLTTVGSCTIGTFTAPIGFSFVRESAVADGVAIGASRNSNVLWGDYFYVDNSGCTQNQPPENFGPAGPFGLFNWGGVAANNVSGNTPGGNGGDVIVEHTTMVLPNSVIILEGNQRHTQPSPFAGRGGPVTSCPLLGTEIDAAQIAIGIGPTAVQVQHSIISGNLVETLGGSSFEDPADSTPACD